MKFINKKSESYDTISKFHILNLFSNKIIWKIDIAQSSKPVIYEINQSWVDNLITYVMKPIPKKKTNPHQFLIFTCHMVNMNTFGVTTPSRRQQKHNVKCKQNPNVPRNGQNIKKKLRANLNRWNSLKMSTDVQHNIFPPLRLISNYIYWYLNKYFLYKKKRTKREKFDKSCKKFILKLIQMLKKENI